MGMFFKMPSAAPIIGHQPLLQSLQNDLEMGNVSHAYLLAGPPNVGKFTVAKWFAEELLTIGLSGSDLEHARHAIKKLLHPDLLAIDQLWIEDTCEDMDVIARSSNVPQDHRRKAKAKTDTIGIDDIRAAQERLHEVGTGTYRCCLIRSAERMQDEAVNALLKLLEEPPEGVVFLLTTSSLPSLLPTLVSRTRLLRFSRAAESELLPLLKDMDEEDRHFLLHLAQGAPGTLLRLRDDPDARRQEKTVHGAATAFWRSTSKLEQLELLSPLHERGKEADNFLLHLSLALREKLPDAPPSAAAGLQALLRGLETNVSRQLLVQRFVLSLEGSKAVGQ